VREFFVGILRNANFVGILRDANFENCGVFGRWKNWEFFRDCVIFWEPTNFGSFVEIFDECEIWNLRVILEMQNLGFMIFP
jgi:hypothetical protein